MVLGGGVILLIIILLSQQCSSKRNQLRLIGDIAKYHTLADTYENKYEEEIAYNKALVLTSDKELKAYLSVNDTIGELLNSFKKIRSVVTQTVAVFIKDSFPYKVKIPCDFKPFQIVRDSSHYFFQGTISRDIFKIDSLSIPNKQTIVFGEKKIGLFKRELRAEIHNSNPLVRTSHIGAYTYKPKKRFYQRPVLMLGLGVATGLIGSQFIK